MGCSSICVNLVRGRDSADARCKTLALQMAAPSLAVLLGLTTFCKEPKREDGSCKELQSIDKVRVQI